MKTLVLEPINISSFFDGSAKDGVASAINRACRNEGIFCLWGHGIPQDLIDRCFSMAFSFFELPEEIKNKVPNSARVPPRGYYPEGAYVKASPQAPKSTDVRSNFSFCEPPSAQAGAYPGNDRGYYWPTVWPEQPAGFEECFMTYNRAMNALSHRVWRIFAYSLGLGEDYFVPLTQDPMSFCGLNYYKPVGVWTPEHGAYRLGPHTDFMAYALLLSRSAISDYEVEVAPDEWAVVSAPAGSIMVQVGDILQMWTNDQWRATKHRVAAPPPSEANHSRVSIVYGVVPDMNAVISPLPTCISRDSPAKYAPTTFVDYEYKRMEKVIAKQEGKAV